MPAPQPVWLDLADRLGERLTLQRWRGTSTQRQFVEALQGIDLRSSRAELPRLAAWAARRLAREGFSAMSVACAQAVVARAITLQLGWEVYPTQHLAAHALLLDQLVEMDTGEGKTLALLLAAGTAALASVPTHVICSNDYLAARDAETANRVLSALGLPAVAIRNDMTPAQRRDAYAQPVVYVSAQEVGFDYLRDRLGTHAGDAAEPALLRGLCLALVDEADSVLLDHAATPLVLAHQAEHESSDGTAAAVLRLAERMDRGRDWTSQAGHRSIGLAAGALERWQGSLDTLGLHRDSRVRAQALVEALTALHALKRDVHYVVASGEVLLIDPTTGRTRPGSVWSRGLHRMVCLKEEVGTTRATRTAIQITLQSLLGRYCKLGGISGTLRESSWQLWWFYRLRVRRIEPRTPSKRRHAGTSVYASRQAQFDVVCERIAQRSTDGQPVLVGTDSVATAEALSGRLAKAGIRHGLLTARDDCEEADLVGAAGKSGTVTVTTNMAGRGTDIVLEAAALQAGGLHVICCTQNASPRIDRQLFGRAARNGQAGSAETLLSLDDDAFVGLFPRVALDLFARCARDDGLLPRPLGSVVARAAQLLAGCREFMRAWALVRNDHHARKILSGTGRPD